MFLHLFGLCLVLSISWAGKDFTSWRKFTHAELITETTSVAPGQAANVALKITLEKNWHTYWSNPGDSGAPPRLSFRNGPGVHVTRVPMPYPKRFETGPLITFGFEKEVIFPIELTLDDEIGKTAHVEVDAEWLVCEDVCIPAVDTLKVDLPVTALESVRPGPDFVAFQRLRQRIPRAAEELPMVREDKDAREFDFGAVAGDFVDFFPFKGAGVTNEAPLVEHAGHLALKLKRSSVPVVSPDRIGTLVVRTPAGTIEAIGFGHSGWKFEEAPVKRAPPSALWMWLSAFVGGLILNLMPCVFPILSIKLMGLLKLAEAHPREVRAQNFAYVLGVLVSFVAVALVLSGLRAAGTLVGWGFQMQSPVFLSALVWLFFVLSLNLFGTFEFDLFDLSVGEKLTRLGGFAGSFFTGVLAVVVASPCTAPFMGVAIGFGLAQPTPYLIATFLALGLGLAFPYLVFALFPGAIRVLPRPGMWMIRVKQIMAFPLLATNIWLLWILGQMRDMNTVAIVLFGALTLAFAFWLAHERHRVLARRLAAVTLVLALILIGRGEHRTTPVAEKGTDTIWQTFSPSALDQFRGEGVMVNMTADWCLTCKVNERLVFDDAEVQALLKSKHLHLLKGDWTQRDADITQFLNRFERVGVPFYVLFSKAHPDGLALPEVLTKKSFIERVNAEYP